MMLRKTEEKQKKKKKSFDCFSLKKGNKTLHFFFELSFLFPFFPSYPRYTELEDRIQLQLEEKFSLQLLPFRKQVFLC